ncbi:ABC transporter transmembrane domain-containing protein [Coralliovum pocilloporae]|uniref:ABC transporter transmembrane domain-containing protein n=1 Tax=Coralliovum pocilloporae TaxID=3066369 RepID=UPI0033071666
MARTESASAEETQQSKRTRQSVRPLASLLPYLRRYRAQIGLAFFALTLAAAATLAIPLAMRRMIDFGFGGSDGGFVDRYFAMLVLVCGVLAFASALRFYCVTWLGERIVSDLRADVFAHVTRLSPGFFDRELSGEVVSRLTADATQIKAVVGASTSVALRNLFLFFGASIMMVVTSPGLSGLVLAAIPFIVLPLVGFGRAVRKKSRFAQDTLANATAYASEAISGVRTMQAFTNEPYASNRFRDSVEKAFAAARSSMGARAALTAFAIFMVSASVVAVLWFGAQRVLAGTMTGGELGQFVLYAVLAASSLGELSQVWGEIALASGAAERMSELLETESDVKAPAEPVRLSGRISGRVAFSEVDFAYSGRRDAPVLRNISLDIQPGETVAIVGPTGSGKSTLFHLLTRFYDVTGGDIQVDQVSLRSLDPTELRQQIAIVPQDTMVFAASALENIRYGRPSASDAEVKKAAELALADEFISRMEQGYETQIGERGLTLSGGQRQRIAIARAILKDAPILLLDEATSALDAESEHLVQQALEQLMKGRTTLVIAHRLATVLKADRIVVLDQGEIAEEGTHQELVQRGGLYAKLARLQFDTASAGSV